MAQEEQRCSNSSASGGGGATGTRSSSKMPKNKQQPPKRGLGVAQLEWIIYKQQQQQKKKKAEEEQHKKKAGAAFAAPPHCFLLPLPQRPPIPFLFPSPADLPPTSSISSPRVGFLTRELPQLPPGWNPMGFYHDAAEERRKFEPSNSIWPPPGAVIKKQDQQHQPPSMVNIPTSPASSSGVNPQMEPPSNQIFHINSTRPWPEEDKVAGRKPLYPYSLEDHPVGVCSAPFRCKLPPPSSPSCHRWDESLCGHDGSKFKYCNVRVREEGPSGSKTIHAAFVEAIKENGSMCERFLSLGLPATSSNPKSKGHKSVPSIHHSEFNLRPFQYVNLIQGSMEPQQEVPRQSQPFYNFLPTRPNSDFSETCAGRAVGADTDVDLNLKL